MNLSNFSDKELVQASQLFPSLWIEQNEIKTEAGLQLEFQDHAFLIDIYNDLSPLQVILKPPQIGATVMHILKSMWVAKMLNKQIIYTLPTEADMHAMVGNSINRLVAQNPVLRSWVKDHDTVTQKTVGDAVINYRGTWSPKQAMMIPSDLNIHDEVDASNAQVITQYETRLQAKAEGMRWYFSHPSLSGFGVDIYWAQSDKHEWVITCPHCEAKQILSWPESISRDRQCYVCKSCDTELSDDVRRKGAWRPTAAGRFRGYHISQLMCPWISAEKILAAKDDPNKDEQYFYNYVLGLPYMGSESKISSAEVLRNVSTDVNKQEGRVIIGVDTGLPIYYVCLNKQGVFYHGTCDDYDQLEKLLNTWKNSIIVSDQGGDLIGIRKLQQKYPGRVFLAFYRKDRKSQELVKWGENDEYGTLQIDRNRFIQLKVVEQLRDVGRVLFNGNVEDWQPFAAHFDNIYRELIVPASSPNRDDRGLYVPEYVWKRNGPDHYVHTLVYALAGLDQFGEDKAQVIKRDSMWRPTTGTTIAGDISGRRMIKRLYKDAEFT